MYKWLTKNYYNRKKYTKIILWTITLTHWKILLNNLRQCWGLYNPIHNGNMYVIVEMPSFSQNASSSIATENVLMVFELEGLIQTCKNAMEIWHVRSKSWRWGWSMFILPHFPKVYDLATCGSVSYKVIVSWTSHYTNTTMYSNTLILFVTTLILIGILFPGKICIIIYKTYISNMNTWNNHYLA